MVRLCVLNVGDIQAGLSGFRRREKETECERERGRTRDGERKIEREGERERTRQKKREGAKNLKECTQFLLTSTKRRRIIWVLYTRLTGCGKEQVEKREILGEGRVFFYSATELMVATLYFRELIPTAGGLYTS